MNSNEIRKAFLDFFEKKGHKIVPSAPMVVKNDPTLMFTNAGMNQFKDIFLGNVEPKYPRVADSQKCLRVSGKHNDLEEVGHDTYHHTMFEMLGNWSFGDYFKEEAIDYAWEFLTDVMKIPADRLYATVFEGNKDDNLLADDEAKKHWQKYLPENKILYGTKKDNFWEMGDTGPCGPCSEIHIDLRDDEDREKIDGAKLVNKDNPLVIEIWNLVFIQFNRKADGKLEPLPMKHVDTGMGFERLCMIVQGKKSNYDTDIFTPIINKISNLTGFKYGDNEKTDIAMRVVADHLRTIAFSIADGQLPSNAKAGYVIRRILRRAVRYAYTFLKQENPFIYKLLPALIDVMGDAYPEIKQQKNIIEKVIIQEEKAFLRTLETGIRLLDGVIKETKEKGYKIVSGKVAFNLYDAHGFPLDLTELILKEHGMVVNRREYDEAMEQQRKRSQEAAKQETDDWVVLLEDDIEEFIGYDNTEAKVRITRYRKVREKGKDKYHLVFNFTPFYAESGGQVGDTGYIEANGKKTQIIDTQKENNVIIHISKELPEDLNAVFHAVVNKSKRQLTMCNHSATHLLHKALRDILGEHVEQKGSLVDAEHLRFDFSHFQKVTDEEIAKIEAHVNEHIRMNLPLEEKRDIPLAQAKEMGAMALFGEKYGDLVRVIKFGDSIELCGGTHVKATGEIGCFKIIEETSVAAGIRRISAITSITAEKYINSQIDIIKNIKKYFKTSKNLAKSVEDLIAKNQDLTKKIEQLQREKLQNIKQQLLQNIREKDGINIIVGKLEADNMNLIKDLAYQLRKQVDNLFLVIGAEIAGKANLTIMISDNLVSEKNLDAGKIIKEAAKEIQGGGGGQKFFATAGGKKPENLDKAINKAIEFLK